MSNPEESEWNKVLPKNHKHKQEINQPLQKVQLVIDANAFIKCLDLNELSKRFDVITIPNVLEEIKDQKAREKFNQLTFDIQTILPDSDSKIKGDFTSLSNTDLELLALAHTIVKRNGKLDKLRKEPPELSQYEFKNGFDNKQQTNITNKIENTQQQQQQQIFDQSPKNQQDNIDFFQGGPQNIEEIQGGEEEEQEDEEQLEEEMDPVLQRMNENQQQSQIQTEDDETQEATNQNLQDQQDDDADADDWITPNNIQKKFKNVGEIKEEDNEVGVFIMSADYDIQNVSMQMGIPILSIDGLLIKRLKRFVLLCNSCRAVSFQMDKQFCPSCGNHGMSKLSVSLNKNGELYYFLKKNYNHNIRGTKYAIPNFKGGRKANDIILREDELLMGGRQHKLRDIERKRESEFYEKQQDFMHGLSFDIKKQSNDHPFSFQYGYGRRNPNDPGQFKAVKNRRKK